MNIWRIESKGLGKLAIIIIGCYWFLYGIVFSYLIILTFIGNYMHNLEPSLLPELIVMSIVPIFIGPVIMMTGAAIVINANALVENRHSILHRPSKTMTAIAGWSWILAGFYMILHIIQWVWSTGDLSYTRMFYNRSLDFISVCICDYGLPLFLVISGVMLLVLIKKSFCNSLPALPLSKNRINLMIIAGWLWIVAGLGSAATQIRDEVFLGVFYSYPHFFGSEFLGNIFFTLGTYTCPFLLIITGIALLIISKKILLTRKE